MDGASKATLENEFGTSNEDECIIKILEKGLVRTSDVRRILTSAKVRRSALTSRTTETRAYRQSKRYHGTKAGPLSNLNSKIENGVMGNGLRICRKRTWLLS
jgi:Shwachman-Bodian-Diamond syndrome (SBDS) protein